LGNAMAMDSIQVAWSEVCRPTVKEQSCLSSEERERAGRFKVQFRRDQFVCGRVLLRSLLERVTGKPAASHEIEVTARGKPVCRNGPAVSISHSGSFVVAAISYDGLIGVDIEGRPGNRDVNAIANSVFAEAEVQWLASQPEDRFYMLWVLKEAWLKATGSGIPGGLDQLSCEVSPPDIRVQASDHQSPTLGLYAMEEMLIGVAVLEPQAVQPAFCKLPLGDSRPGDTGGVRRIAST
jgi:phosphopantetheinyl transferase